MLQPQMGLYTDSHMKVLDKDIRMPVTESYPKKLQASPSWAEPSINYNKS